MAKMCVPDAGCAGLDIDGKRYRARGGYVDIPDHLTGRAKKAAECFDAYEPPRGVAGFVCEDCGFHALFRTCGRCGGTCTRPEGVTHAR